MTMTPEQIAGTTPMPSDENVRVEFEAASSFCGETLISRGWRLHARALEALDTANARADKADADSREWQDRHDYQQERAVKAEAQRDAAEKRERELREAVALADKELAKCHYSAESHIRSKLRTLIQPEPDPLVEALYTMLDAERAGYHNMRDLADDLTEALAKHGGKVVFEDQTP